MSEPVTLPAPDVPVAPPPVCKWERERHAFLQLLPELLRTHPGQFVAIHDEKVVDSGDDPVALIKRVHARFGYVPIHVGMVAAQPPVAVRISHYRESACVRQEWCSSRPGTA